MKAVFPRRHIKKTSGYGRRRAAEAELIGSEEMAFADEQKRNAHEEIAFADEQKRNAREQFAFPSDVTPLRISRMLTPRA